MRTHAETSLKFIKQFQETSTITEVDNGLLLSFKIESNDELEKKNDEGLNVGLRDILDSFFVNPVVRSIAIKNMKTATKTDEEDSDLVNLYHAFEQAIENSYKKKSKCFWIDGE